jgi:hypothetical protein
MAEISPIGVETYVFKARSETRAVVTSIVLVPLGLYVGYHFMYRADEFNPMYAGIGFTLGLVGLVWAITIPYLQKRSSVTAVLDLDGFSVTGPDTKSRGKWSEVTAWAIDPKRTGLVLARGKERTRIIAPLGADDPLLKEFFDSVRAHINTAKNVTGIATKQTTAEALERAVVAAHETAESGFDPADL